MVMTMNRCDEWNFFIQKMQETALDEYRTTREYELRKMRQAYLEDVMSNELTLDQKVFIDEVLFELITFHEQEADLLYHQGIKDGMWILKTLGVLA